MKNLKGFEEKNNLIVVTGMLGSNVYSTAATISSKLSLWHLNYDIAVAEWLDVCRFSSKEERKEMKGAAAKVFFLDWHNRLEDNNSIVVSGAFTDAWSGLFKCTCEEHGYNLVVVDCIPTSFDEAYKSHIDIMKSDKFKVLSYVSNDERIVVDDEFGTGAYRDKMERMYLNNEYNSIDGDINYISEEVSDYLLRK